MEGQFSSRKEEKVFRELEKRLGNFKNFLNVKLVKIGVIRG